MKISDSDTASSVSRPIIRTIRAWETWTWPRNKTLNRGSLWKVIMERNNAGMCCGPHRVHLSLGILKYRSKFSLFIYFNKYLWASPTRSEMQPEEFFGDPFAHPYYLTVNIPSARYGILRPCTGVMEIFLKTFCIFIPISLMKVNSMSRSSVLVVFKPSFDSETAKESNKSTAAR